MGQFGALEVEMSLTAFLQNKSEKSDTEESQNAKNDDSFGYRESSELLDLRLSD